MTKKYLNLGCGRIILPSTVDNPMLSHIAYSLGKACPDAFNPEADWCNADRIPGEGIAEVFDAFAYPFVRSSNGSPFNDDTFDEIWISHLAEHIPHQPRYTAAITMYPELERAGGEDGWYAFFGECWRITKPGGIVHVLSPVANHFGAFTDPSHHRYLIPEVFGYFKPNPNAPFDYWHNITAKFEAVGEPEVIIEGEAEEMLQAAHTAEETLKTAIVGGASPEVVKLAQANKDMAFKLFSRFATSHWNTVKEFCVSLRVIKE